MITETEPSLIDMLAALLESISLKDTIMCILLDWNCPWSWLREMRFWLRQWERTIKLLKTSSQKSQSDIEDFQISWQSHLRTFTEDPKGKVNGLAQLDAAIVLPLSEGQFDHSLGVPLICVAQNVCPFFTIVLQYAYFLGREHQHFGPSTGCQGRAFRFHTAGHKDCDSQTWWFSDLYDTSLSQHKLPSATFIDQESSAFGRQRGAKWCKIG